METIITGPGFYKTRQDKKVRVLVIDGDRAIGLDEEGTPDSWRADGRWWTNKTPYPIEEKYDIVGPWIEAPDVGEGYEPVTGEETLLDSDCEYCCMGPGGTKKWRPCVSSDLTGVTIRHADAWWSEDRGYMPVFYRRKITPQAAKQPIWNVGDMVQVIDNPDCVYHGEKAGLVAEVDNLHPHWEEGWVSLRFLGNDVICGFHEKNLQLPRWTPTPERVTLQREVRGLESRWVQVEVAV